MRTVNPQTVEVSDEDNELILANFPFPEPRAGQTEIIQTIINAYRDGKRGVILEAGTGTGKSVIGIAAARIIKNLVHQDVYKGNLDVKVKTAVVTKTRNLQQQYEDQFGTDVVSVLWGKSHYSDIPKDAPESTRVHQCSKSCPSMSFEHSSTACPYMVAFLSYLNPSTVGVANNSLYVSAPLFSDGVEVLVVDECHKLPDVCYDLAQIEISSQKLLNIAEKYNLECGSTLSDCAVYEATKFEKGEVPIRKIRGHWKGLARLAVTQMVPDMKQRLSVLEELPMKTPKALNKIETLNREITNLQKFSAQVESLIKDADDDDNPWIISKNVETKKRKGLEEEIITFIARPLNLRERDSVHFTKLPTFSILMSATVSPDLVVEEMGFNSDEWDYILAPTTFPVENRKVVYQPAGSMNYRNRKEMLSAGGAMANAIVGICAKHSGQSGLIHTVSYQNAYDIAEVLKSSNIQYKIPPRGIVVDADYINKLPKGTVLLSPALAEGVDLADDLCRFQIIVKMPYPYLGDPWINHKKNRNIDWYTNQAVMDVIQMVGRGVRSSEDYCTAYVIDSNFSRLSFPTWFNEAVI